MKQGKPLDYRLKRSEDFDRVFKKGTRVFSNSLTLIYLSADSLKVGYAVGKKHGGSVKRNRIKRLLRESFRSYLPRLKNRFFFVFIPKVKEEYTLKSFHGDMGYLLKKAGMFSNEKNRDTSH